MYEEIIYDINRLQFNVQTTSHWTIDATGDPSWQIRDNPKVRKWVNKKMIGSCGEEEESEQIGRAHV